MNKSHKELILKWLKTKPITPIIALNHFGCFRLSARIYDLKKDGYSIHTKIVKTAGGSHVAEYRLRRKQ